LTTSHATWQVFTACYDDKQAINANPKHQKVVICCLFMFYLLPRQLTKYSHLEST